MRSSMGLVARSQPDDRPGIGWHRWPPYLPHDPVSAINGYFMPGYGAKSIGVADRDRHAARPSHHGQ